jgi:murein DD-endopeptidase MepM/ murein hydrolase activator NlpD
MTMAKRFYTILILPDATRPPLKFHISRFTLIGITVGLSSLFLCVFVFILQYINMNANMLELKRLRKEVAHFSSLGEKMQEMQREMTRLQEFDKKIRTLAQLQPSGLEEPVIGEGGGEGLEKRNLAESMRLEKEQLMARMEQEITALEGAAKHQESSFSELKHFLENKRTLLSCTPAIWPVRGWLTGTFGYRRSPFTGQKQLHEGLDIAASPMTSIIAPADGTAIYSGFMPGWGNVLILNHGYGCRTFFAHSARNLVSPGKNVKRGQVIAYVGNTGQSTGPHLHYEVHINGVPRDPLKYIID